MDPLAEVDGNRTRRTGIDRPTALKAAEPTRCSDTSGRDVTRIRVEAPATRERPGVVDHPRRSVLSPHRLSPWIHPRPPADSGNVMVTLCWAAKGGSGTTVVTASMALATPRPRCSSISTANCPLSSGCPNRSGPASPTGSPPTPRRATSPICCSTSGRRRGCSRGAATPACAPCRAPIAGPSSRLAPRLADEHGGDVTIDGRTGTPPAPLIERVDHALLVTRPCYLSLRRACGPPLDRRA